MKKLIKITLVLLFISMGGECESQDGKPSGILQFYISNQTDQNVTIYWSDLVDSILTINLGTNLLIHESGSGSFGIRGPIPIPPFSFRYNVNNQINDTVINYNSVRILIGDEMRVSIKDECPDSQNILCPDSYVMSGISRRAPIYTFTIR